MPLPWKKSKVNRISRLVADLQSPSKRGGSLVVETGFPTSLVDLFVKNRDRLKKPSSKKKKKSSPVEISDHRNNPLPSPVVLSSVSSDSGDLIRAETVRNEVVEVGSVEGGIECGGDGFVECDDRLDVKSGLLKVLMIFVVMILGFCLKKFVVGITLSAFVLLFFEFVGNRINCCWFKSCVDELRQRFWILVSNNVTTSTKEDNVVSGLSVSISTISPIETVESNVEMDLLSEEVISRTTKDSEVLSRHRRWGCLEREREREREIKVVEEFEDRGDSGKVLLVKDLLELEDKDDSIVVLLDKDVNQSKRSGKIKSKFLKKLVPKKLRNTTKGSKEKELESRSENSGYLEVDKLWTNEEREMQEDGYKLLESENGTNPGCIEQQVDQADGEENVETKRKGNSGYVIILLIVLAGLVRGRLLAVILTIIWCLGMKLVGNQRKSVNVPNKLGLVSQLRIRMFGGLC